MHNCTTVEAKAYHWSFGFRVSDYSTETIIMSKETFPSSTETSARPVTTSRMVNLFLMFLYGAVLFIHIVCLAVMAAKHDEIVNKFKDDRYYQHHNIKGSCMLFVDYDGQENNVDWVNNNCHLVIYGSGALGGCALLMIVFLMIRTLLFRKINFLIILDGIEVVLTGLFAGVLAVIITLGKNETCKSFEHYSAYHNWHESCEDFYLRSSKHNPNKRHAQIYEALRIAEITSWIAVGVIGVIGTITLIRVWLWFAAINRSRRHDSQLQDVLSSSKVDDDLQPLHI